MSEPSALRPWVEAGTAARGRVGSTGLWKPPGKELRVAVRVAGCRSVFGRWELAVEPTTGTGIDWVAVETVEFD
jgi:hypothetical protein